MWIREYSDVEYLGHFYLDAELVDGIWYIEDHHGNALAFEVQARVKAQNPPSPERRHPVYGSRRARD